jgi:hypothetical protein
MALPSPVIDHVVIDVRDHIDEAMRCFASLGFLLTPRGRHTLGSVNHLAMFATDYLELLGFGEDGATRTELARFPRGFNGLVFNRCYRYKPSRALLRSTALSATRGFAPPGSIRRKSQSAASIFAST